LEVLAEAFALRLSGSGASGSTFASRTGFVTGLADASACLSTDFACLAAARPGLSTAFFSAGFAAVTGLAVDLEPAVFRGKATAGSDGTSRVPVFKLAS
jgi:hypothetical protein